MLASQPSQDGYYKIKAKGGYTQYGDNECLIGISIGNPNYEGLKLEAILNWAYDRFKTVHVMVADTLQRFNLTYLEDIDTEHARERCLKNGQNWVNENKDLLSSSNIILWDDLITLEQTIDYKARLELAYESNLKLRYEVDKTIKKIHNRLYKSDSDLYSIYRFKEFYEASKNFILEETAVACYTEKVIDGPTIYPGEFSIKYILDEDNNLRDDMKFISIDIIKNKSFKKAA